MLLIPSLTINVGVYWEIRPSVFAVVPTLVGSHSLVVLVVVSVVLVVVLVVLVLFVVLVLT